MHRGSHHAQLAGEVAHELGLAAVSLGAVERVKAAHGGALVVERRCWRMRALAAAAAAAALAPGRALRRRVL